MQKKSIVQVATGVVFVSVSSVAAAQVSASPSSPSPSYSSPSYVSPIYTDPNYATPTTTPVYYPTTTTPVTGPAPAPAPAATTPAVVTTVPAPTPLPDYSCSADKCGGAFGQTAATQLIAATTFQQMQTISDALANRNLLRQGGPNKVASNGQRFGMAAGGVDKKFNVWGNVSDSSSEYKDNLARMSVDSLTTVLGADYALSPTLVVGVSAAFDDLSGRSGEKYNGDGYSVAPYVGWQINNEWSLDATVGFGNTDTKTKLSKTKADADRMFYGTNLNYTRWMGNLQFSGRASYMYGREKYDDNEIGGVAIAGTSSTNKLRQFRVGGQVAYWADGFMPYVGLAFTNDSRSVSNRAVDTTRNMGKDAWLWSAGVNYVSVKNNLVAGIGYQTESGRDKSDRDAWMASVNYRF